MKKLLVVFCTIVLTLLSMTTCQARTENNTVSGRASATVQGYEGPVTVTVTFAKGKLVNVEALGPDETFGIGTKAIEKLPLMILDSGSANVDVITGASITSGAVISAAMQAINEVIELSLHERQKE